MKLILLSFIFIYSLDTDAQITFERSVPTEFTKATTTSAGDKFLRGSGDSVIIYNSDWSLYAIVTLPANSQYCPMGSDFYGGEVFPSLSDNLFNSDSLLEFLVSTNLGGGRFTLTVYNELGQSLFTFPDTTFSNPNVVLFSTSGSFKLSYIVGINNAVKIFSLPGSLPCNQCNFTSGIIEPINSGGMAGLVAYPNPFNNTLSIEYSLLSKQDARLILTTVDGKELKNIQLQDQSDKLTLNTNDLPKGIIIASLYGNNAHLISKKLVKIE